MNPSDIPTLEGFLTVPEVATRLGVSRQRAHQIVKAGTFPNARLIGDSKVIVVPEEDVETYQHPDEKKSSD